MSQKAHVAAPPPGDARRRCSGSRPVFRLGWDLGRPELQVAIAAIRPYRLGLADEQVNVLFARISKEVARQSQSQDIDDIEDSEDDNHWSADPDELAALLKQGIQLLAEVADSKWEVIWTDILSKAKI